MDYYFQDYVFKSEQLILLKQGQLVKLRVNEAKLLALLLSDPEVVFSKEDIFSNVWAGKVVTEQAIFQNISRLRNIFENQAIINHPKKGYQWNITLIPSQQVCEVPADGLITNQTTENAKPSQKYMVMLFSLFLIIGFYFFYSANSQSSHTEQKSPSLKLALMPMQLQTTDSKPELIKTSSAYEKIKIQSTDNDVFLINQVTESLSYRQLQANIFYLLWDKIAEHQADALLLLDFSSKYGKHALNFSVQAKGFSWYGELLGYNLDDLITQLRQQLFYLHAGQLIQQSDITSKSINAKLTLLHQQYPEDVIILNLLINNQIKTGYLNEALLLITRLNSLAEQQNNLSYLGKALLLKTSVYLQRNYVIKARETLKSASELFNGNGSIEDKMTLLSFSTRLAFRERDYQQIKIASLDMIQLAKSIGDYGRQFNTMLNLTVKAQKFEQLEDKKNYFQQAKQIYQREFFVPQAEVELVFSDFVIARSNKNEARQISMLQKVLAITKKYQGVHPFYKNEAQDILANIFSNKKQFDDALTLFNFEQKLTDKENYLLAKIYLSWEKPTKAIGYAKQAYNDAIWAGEISVSLDSALLLLELSNSEPGEKLIHQDLYVKYIRDHYLPFWLTMNKTRLLSTQQPELITLAELDKS
jgi:DNA-binding winged helix-turn-helix (wHTH) protein